MKQPMLAAAIAAPLLLAACASMHPAGDAPAMARSGLLVNRQGMTLYTFDRDVAGSGKSACNGDCAVKWPPLLARESERPVGDYTVVVRNDGKRQWAWRGKPLYTWLADQQPGDKQGDNYNKAWHIVAQ